MPTHATGEPVFDTHLVRAAIVASAGAGAIHLGATYDHVLEYAPAGMFMFTAGMVQIAWTLGAALRPSISVFRAGALANLGVISLWLVSRTVGLPVGEHPWMPEDIHTTDVLATSLETLMVVCCLALVRPWALREARFLFTLGTTGAFFAALVTGHNSARERAVALATLCVLGSLGGVAAVLKRVPKAFVHGRDNVQAAHDRRRLGLFDGDPWPTVGAGGI